MVGAHIRLLYPKRGNDSGYGKRHEMAFGREGNYKPWQRPTFGENPSEPKLVCKTHKKEKCLECNDVTDAHTCNALLAEYVELKCGCTIPVVADACKVARKGNMPVSEGKVNGRQVSVLRDSGCSTIVVKRDLVEKSQLTGKETVCVLIDGTVRRTPLARISIDTIYYKGDVEAVCMRNPLYELIIGNMKGIKESAIEEIVSAVETKQEECSTIVEEQKEVDVDQQILEDNEVDGEREETQAVMTRRMKAEENKSMKPLNVTAEIDAATTRADVIRMQKADKSLTTVWNTINTTPTVDDIQPGENRIVIKGELLHRILKSRDGRVKSQLVLPKEMRVKALRLAHEGVMSGHQGINKTTDRLTRVFWFPGIGAEVIRYCRSCDICQRTVAKGRVARVELGHMPIIDTPFDRVAVDLIGPIEPMSARGHRYILTVVDYATRYPEAVALKNINTETVAEALVEIYSKVGIPKEVLSDQGSQFV